MSSFGPTKRFGELADSMNAVSLIGPEDGPAAALFTGRSLLQRSASGTRVAWRRGETPHCRRRATLCAAPPAAQCVPP